MDIYRYTIPMNTCIRSFIYIFYVSEAKLELQELLQVTTCIKRNRIYVLIIRLILIPREANNVLPN